MEENQCMTNAVKAELKEKYLAVRKLLDEDSKNDPESAPFISKYAAMDILKNMQNILYNSVDNAKQQESEVTSMLAVVYLNEGIIALETEDLKQGEDHLLNCIDTLNKTESNSRTILPMISALNQLGLLWSRRDDEVKAKNYLEQAEKIYKNYKVSLVQDTKIMSMSALFDIQDPHEPPASEILEKLHTLTLYYLAQIYGTLEDLLKSAVYCHMTLKRQLEMNDFETIDWALNAATLSQFFMEKGGFQQARHHLAAATYILGKYEDDLKAINLEDEKDKMEQEVLASKWENFKHRSADISRCWAKYGLLLLGMSRERLIANTDKNDDNYISDNTNMKTDSKTDISQECLNGLKFNTIEKDIEHIANSITDKFALDFNDAKSVFLNVQKWLDDAKTYYSLEDHASDYVQIIQDMSHIYKILSFFEENDDRQSKMHKRRIDLLEGVVKELNEKYYQADCRQIWIELGETYSEILEIKLDRLKEKDERPTPQMLSKINNLTKSAIQNFTKFLDSLKDSKSEKFSDEMIRPALYCYFHLGRLYNKFITPDKALQLENTKNSFENYSFLINYCEKDQKASELMADEINICKDFVKLLPMKLSILTKEISKP